MKVYFICNCNTNIESFSFILLTINSISSKNMLQLTIPKLEYWIYSIWTCSEIATLTMSP